MHDIRSKKKWRERLERSGYLIGAVLLHLIVFLLVATWVIWRAPTPPPTDEFHSVAVKIVSPPPQPPSSGAEANNPELEPQAVVIPVVAPPSTITTAQSTFTVDTSHIVNQAMSHLNLPTAQGTGLSTGGGGSMGTGNGFGSSTGSENGLSGYFYDLKQTPNRQSTGMDQDGWKNLLTKYIAQGWADSLLAPFYKSKTPLYTDTFAISTRLSEEAPKAFKLENEVQPSLWVIHYHAKVIPPEPGDYRFAGFGDDLLVVSINGTLVLDAGWVPLTKKDDLHHAYPFVWSPIDSKFDTQDNNCFLKKGAIFHVDLGDPVDMDVLIGDWGGNCSYYLFIEKIGNTYEKLPDGTPKLPFFQLNSNGAPKFLENEEHPPYSRTPEPWQTAEN